MGIMTDYWQDGVNKAGAAVGGKGEIFPNAEEPPVSSADNYSYGIQDIIGESNIGTVDFFNLYGLAKYTTDDKKTNTFLGYLPIEITTTKFSTDVGTDGFADNVDEKDDSGLTVKIVLPWKPQELRDSVSVNFSKKTRSGSGAGGIENLIRQAGGKLLSDFTGSDLASQFLTTEYNAESLKKEIGLDFILPIGVSKTKTYDMKWINEVRAGLGKLQGLVYPKGWAALYPPLLKIKVGNIYSGFKGYINSVELSFSEDSITLEDGSVFPLVINGSIRFINLFTYGWFKENSEAGGAVGGLTGEFNLSTNPALLFGVQRPDMFAPIANMRTAAIINNSSMIAKKEADTATGVTVINPIALIQNASNISATDLNYDSFKNSIEMSDRNVGILTGYADSDPILTNQLTQYINTEYVTDDMILSDTSNLYNMYTKNHSIINNDDMEFLNITKNNDLISSSNNIMNKVLNVQTIEDYARLIKNIKSGNAIDILASLARVTTGSSGVLNSNLNNILNSTKIGTSILRTLDISGINLNNIAALYGNIEELLKYINKIEVTSPTAKNDFATAVYVSTSQSNKIQSVLNSVNSNINETNSRYTNNNASSADSILTSLSNLSNTAITTEIYNNYDMYKEVMNSLTYKATELADSKIINTNVLNSTAKMSDYVKKVDTSSITGTSDILKTALSKIDELI